MSLIDRITNEIKGAMKAREQLKLDALRSIKKELLEARSASNSGGTVSEDEELKIVQRMVKQRKDSANIYSAQGRVDLYDKEMEEAEIISQFLPAQLSPGAMEDELKQIIDEVGADSLKDMGKVMGVASKKLAGRADGKDVSDAVKRMLSES
jgi:uncharacterized protein YqeY